MSWQKIKDRLKHLDQQTLLLLVRDLYALNNENKLFLATRYGLGDNDNLSKYKAIIDRWLYPELHKNQQLSIAKAKKSISDYKKAKGEDIELIELMVYFCERAAAFSDDVGLQDEGYFNALIGMFEQSLKAIATLAPEQHLTFLERLDNVRDISSNFGYGIADELNVILLMHQN